jgi:hypothetical protein
MENKEMELDLVDVPLGKWEVELSRYGRFTPH